MCNDKITYPCSDFTETEKAEYREELKRIDGIVTNGHTRHCACRQVWGDGLCECKFKKADGAK